MHYTVILEEYEDVRYPATLTAVHILKLEHGRMGTVRAVAERHLRKNPPRAYEIEYHQAWVGIGAGDYWEQVLVRLFDAASSGAVEAVVGALIGWYIARRKRENRKLGYDQSSFTWEQKLEWHLDSLERQIAHHFKISESNLVLVETEQKDHTIRAVFRDSLGNQYEATLGDQGYVQLRKLK